MMNKGIIVIADDITGAAEIAGIAFTHGLDTRLLAWGAHTRDKSFCEESPHKNSSPRISADVTVIATDTRSMTEAEAIAETRSIASALAQQISCPLPPAPCPLFKKTDSALRGHVVAELRTLLETIGGSKAVYLPANPSKNRIVRKGVYYIDGVPIAETAFSYDPEFPAETSSLAERFPDAVAHGIVMPDAASASDIQQAIQTAVKTDESVVFAGAADFFTACLDGLWAEPSFDISTSRHLDISTFRDSDIPISRASGTSETTSSSLVLCGSTQSRPPGLDLPICPMPLSLYDGGTDLSPWLAEATPLYNTGPGLILTIPHHHRTGRTVAVHLRQTMARMAAALIDSRLPQELIIEGGATAFTTLQQLGWDSFRIVGQLAPGVVRMQADNQVYVTMKPGSYPWKL